MSKFKKGDEVVVRGYGEGSPMAQVWNGPGRVFAVWESADKVTVIFHDHPSGFTEGTFDTEYVYLRQSFEGVTFDG